MNKNKMTKICLFTKREYSFKGRQGDLIEGVMYGGITENNSILEFSSQNPNHQILTGVPKYQAEQAVEINLKVSLSSDHEGNAKFKYSEIID